MTKPTTFEEYWYKLVSDEIWYDRIKYQYANKDIKDVANNAFIDLLAQRERWDRQDYSDFRKHLQKWLIYAKPAAVKPQLQQVIEEKPSHNKPVVTGEARQKYLQEWLNSVKNVQQQASLVPRLTNKQIADEGDWLPPKDKPHTSTSVEYFIKSEIHNSYIKHNYDIISGDPNLDWKPENEWIKDNEKEIQEWIKNLK